MNNIIGADAAKLAGLQIDTLQKYKAGQLSLEHWDRFINLSLKAREERFGARSYWRKEENGLIRFSLVANGLTGPEWDTYLVAKEGRISDPAKSILRSPDFKPTPVGTILDIAVIPGVLFVDRERMTQNIHAYAANVAGWKLVVPPADTACLIRDRFSDGEIEAMGLMSIIAMHETIKVAVGGPRLLCASRLGGGRWLGAYWVRPGGGWHRVGGLAFLVSPALGGQGK